MQTNENAPDPDSFTRTSPCGFSPIPMSWPCCAPGTQSRGTLPAGLHRGQGSRRGVLGGMHRRLAKVAWQIGRPELGAVSEDPDGERLREARAVAHPARARYLDAGRPHRTDSAPAPVVERHSRARPCQCGRIEAFFAAHPPLMERARALIAVSPASGIVPWEQLRLPNEVDGSAGAYRAPPIRSMQTTTTRRCRRGHHYTSLPRRSARTARRLSGSSCGQSSSGGRHCRHSPSRTRLAAFDDDCD